MVRIHAARLSVAALAASVLAACAGGGGGGGGGSPAVAPVSPPPPPPPASRPSAVVFPPGTRPSTSSAEYQRNWGVAGVKAEAAWQRGFTGRGVVVGVIDDGLIPTEPELAGRVHPASTDIVSSRNQLTGPGTHGTELAVFIAGAFNDVATVGVAYEATILGVRADDPGCTSTNCGFLNADLARGLDYAVAQGAKVVNFSLGSSAPSSTAFRDAIQRATAAGVIIVVSAGNDGPTAPDVNFPGRFASDSLVSNGLIVTVGALTQSGTAATFSNLAGPSANWFLMAPGDAVFTIDTGAVGATDPAFQSCFADFTCRMQGTSYSAPHVAGAVALLLQAFPGLTPQQIVQLLLRSTDDLGVAGVDAQFGWGKLNVERAFAPVGTVSAPLPGAAGGVTPGAGLGVPGAAYGDALSSPTAWSTVGFDEFGRTFRVSLDREWRAPARDDVAEDSAPLLWRAATQSGGITAMMALTPSEGVADMRQRARGQAFRIEGALAPGWRLAFASQTPAVTDATAPLQAGLFGLAGVDASAALTRELGARARLSLMTQSGERPREAGMARSRGSATAVRFESRHGPVTLAATLGAMREDGRALGLSINPRVGAAPDASGSIQGLGARVALAPGLSFDAAAEFGRTRVRGGPAWMQAASEFTTSAGRVGLTLDAPPAPGVGGKLSLSLSQPLRVESGAFTLTLPDADAWGRSSLTSVQRTLAAVPSGRELEARIGYSVYSGGAFAADASIAARREPGHVKDAPTETVARVGLRAAF